MKLPTNHHETPEAWDDDVPLRGPDMPEDDGHIRYLIEYLLTVHKRFGNTTVTFDCDLQWGAAALHKWDAQKERIDALERELAERTEALKASEAELSKIRVILAGTDIHSLPNDYSTTRMAQTIRADRDKFMWQVRDTCKRAEAAESALASAREEVRERCAKVCDEMRRQMPDKSTHDHYIACAQAIRAMRTKE